jgi:hypothetical protein
MNDGCVEQRSRPSLDKAWETRVKALKAGSRVSVLCCGCCRRELGVHERAFMTMLKSCPYVQLSKMGNIGSFQEKPGRHRCYYCLFDNLVAGGSEVEQSDRI